MSIKSVQRTPYQVPLTFYDGAEASAAPSGLRIAIRFLSGAPRRPSSGCSGRSPTRVSSRVRPPLIRSPVRQLKNSVYRKRRHDEY